MLNVAVLNGGRGAASIIPAMLAHQGLNVTSIVNAYDDGKSTGEIRRFFDMLGPSDIRKVQELMLPEEDPHVDTSRALFGYRYPDLQEREPVLSDMRRFAGGQESVAGISVRQQTIRSTLQTFVREFVDALEVIEAVKGEYFSFSDCALMNCLYAGAFLSYGRDMESATKAIDRLFRLKGTVLPNSVENKWLAAVRENGDLLSSEAEIVELRSNVRIDRLYLLNAPIDRARLEGLSPERMQYYLGRHHSPVAASPGVRLALEQADIIVYAAGTQHSSLYPTYMSRGVASTIASNRTALKVFVTNIGADYETPSYRSSDYLLGAYKFLCLADDRIYSSEELFDATLINRTRIKPGETYVEDDADSFGAIPVQRVVGDFEAAESPGKHDGPAVVAAILDLYDQLER